MQDEIDVLLSRSLKNWAARQEPPQGGRQRLMRQVALSGWLEEGDQGDKSYRMMDVLRSKWKHPPPGWWDGSLTMPAWPMQVASPLRMVS